MCLLFTFFQQKKSNILSMYVVNFSQSNSAGFDFLLIFHYFDPIGSVVIYFLRFLPELILKVFFCLKANRISFGSWNRSFVEADNRQSPLAISTENSFYFAQKIPGATLNHQKPLARIHTPIFGMTTRDCARRMVRNSNFLHRIL